MRIHRHRQRIPKLQIPDYKINQRITSEEIYVISETGEQLGVMKTARAIELAQERELDLVEVGPKATPPVAKFLDFKQFKYQKEKEIKKQRAQSKEVEVKGIRLSLRIADGDKKIRLAAAQKFMEKGNKVKIELILRGREKAHDDLAKEIIGEFIEMIRGLFPIRLEQPIKNMGGRVTAIVARE